MICRTAIYTRTSGELKQDLRQKIETGGNIVVDVFADHEIAGQSRRSHTGRNRLLAALDGIDQIAMASAGDIPAKTVGDLLRLLGILRDHGVGLLLVAENIDTEHGSALTVLEIIEAFKRARLSEAIRRGLAKSTRRIGRPQVPSRVRRQIEAALAAGEGIRPTARKFGVAPATVINVRRTMVQPMAKAA